jgi:endoglucanase
MSLCTRFLTAALWAALLASPLAAMGGTEDTAEAEAPVVLPPAPAFDRAVFTDIPPGLIAETLSPGWNLGNQLEGIKLKTDAATGTMVTTPSETGYQATKVTNELLAAVKAAGFRFVRIPVSYFSLIDDAHGYKIDPAWLARIKEVVDLCQANGLYAMVNIHGDGYNSIKNAWLLCNAPDQKPILAKYTAVWKQLAETFRDYNQAVLFESMNEEFDGNYNGPNPTAYENINAYNEAFVKTVRGTGGNNAKRWLLLAGWNTNIDQTVDGFGTPGHFRLPADNRVMVSVHFYDPWGFCGGENGTATEWGSFAPNPAKVNGSEVSMAKQFNKLRDTFTSKKIPVVIGEWGSIDKTVDDPASNASRAYFAQKVTENALRIGAVPVYWDNGWNGKYGFGLFNRGKAADAQGNVVPGTVAVTQQGILNAIMRTYLPGGTSASPATVALDQPKLTLATSGRASLKANVAGGTPQDRVTWSSTDETVAVVKDGAVVPTGPGYCYIKATLPNGNDAQCDLTVEAAVGIQAKVYLFEGAGWSSVKSTPLFIKPGVDQEYEVKFHASDLVLTNIAALYLKDVEVEENHAPTSDAEACPITVEALSINGVAVPLVKNEAIDAVNGKKQFDLPLINEWAPSIEMIAGFPKSGNRDITKAVPAVKLVGDNNEVVVRFRVLPGAGATAAAAEPVKAKPTLDPAKTYHAYFGVQAADSWVFRNAVGNTQYGGGTPEFQGGLFDTENAKTPDGHVPGKVIDASFTGADLIAGKTITVSCTGFDLSDKNAVPAALNAAMVSTDIPFGTVQITSAKLFFDGKQVNLKEGQDLFGVDIDNFNVLVNFINIWQTSLKTFGYTMPVKDITMEFTAKPKTE